MEIESTTFGTITMDGKTYEHDVIVRLSGEVVKRKKKTVEEVLRHRGASSSLLVRAKLAMCVYRRKPKPISRKRTARFCCSLPPRRSMCSTGQRQRRLGFFT